MPSSLTADDDPSNDAVLWGVAIGEEGIKKYPVLLAENFLDFKQLRQFNAGNTEPSVQALVDPLDGLTGAFQTCCKRVCALRVSLPQNKTRAREPPQVRMHCVAQSKCCREALTYTCHSRDITRYAEYGPHQPDLPEVVENLD